MYTEEEARKLVIEAGIEMLGKGLIARTWGNISARISDTQFVVTPSGLAYDTLNPEDLVIVNIADQEPVGPGKPSSEKGVHAAIYSLRPEVNAVIHTHQDYATVMSALSQDLSLRYRTEEERKLLGNLVPLAAYGLSSTKKLTEAVKKEFQENPGSCAVLMRNHGAVIAGKDFDEAFKAAEALEVVSRNRYKEMLGKLWPEEADKKFDPASGVLREDMTDKLSVVSDGKDGTVLRSEAPFTLRYSAYGKKLIPYVDDLAMACGYDIPCVKPERFNMGSLKEGCAILVKGEGAYVRAVNREEAETLCILLEKGSRMGLLRMAGLRPEPVTRIHALIEHAIYVKKYSKLKSSK